MTDSGPISTDTVFLIMILLYLMVLHDFFNRLAELVRR